MHNLLGMRKTASSMTETDLAETLGNVLLEDAVTEILPTTSILSYREAGVMTADAGLVIRLADGSEFQITVVKSR